MKSKNKSEKSTNFNTEANLRKYRYQYCSAD